MAASVRSTGAPAWSTELPGSVLGAGAWAKGSVVALAIDDRVQIGDRTFGARKKNDVVMVWLDETGKVSDAVALKLPITAETAAFTVDARGAGIIAVKVGKKHVLAKASRTEVIPRSQDGESGKASRTEVIPRSQDGESGKASRTEVIPRSQDGESGKASGAEGQSWTVKLGELERASVVTNSAGDVWLAGTALSLEDDLQEAGAKIDKKRTPCGDTGFGFVARFDAAGQVQSARVLERGVAGFGLDPGGQPMVAVEFVGDVSTATGAFTSAGYAAKTADCDQLCEKSCSGEKAPEECERCKASCTTGRASAINDAVCSSQPDVLIGAITPTFDFAWARQLSVEGELSIEGFGVTGAGLTYVAAMSAGRIRVIGGAREATLPSGVSLLVFR